ncbi:MAG: NADH-quinone oxidoreductase subunit M [SAR202 cluster bacterium]|nr:NADH-quinone oxidoreductase subunit M [SAR202 cluster bacterium]
MSGIDRFVLEGLIYVPMIAALVLVFVPSRRRGIVRWLSVATGVVLLALSLYVFLGYDRGAGAPVFQFAHGYPWLERLGIRFALGVDGFAVPMVLLTGIVSATGALVAMKVEHETKSYYVLLFLLIAGVYGTFVSVDMFFFFLFYELAVVPMYLLIGVWGSTNKEYGALKLVLMLVAGSVLVWIGIIAIWVAAKEGGFPTFDIPTLQANADALFSPTFQRVVFPLIMIGFGVLAGLWPFHTWSPDGHVAAPTTVSMLHAGVLMKLGAFGIIRIGMTLLPSGMEDWALVLFILGTVNVIYGAASALAQRDLKYVIGYSSVSHMGYVLMGIATLEPVGLAGATLQMFSHGVMTALFFAIIGTIYDRAHTRDIDALNGLASRMGWTTAFFVIAGLTSLGLPGLSGFIAELLVFIGAFRTQPVLGVLGVIGAAMTATYMLRLIAKVFFGPRDPKWDRLNDLSLSEGIAATGLLIPIVLIGVYPAPFLDIIDRGVGTLLAVAGG